MEGLKMEKSEALKRGVSCAQARKCGCVRMCVYVCGEEEESGGRGKGTSANIHYAIILAIDMGHRHTSEITEFRRFKLCV